MNVLTPPRHRLISQALTDGRTWCTGRVIDGRPALVHAVRVAVTIGRHEPHASPELIAAALLHDSPEFAPPGTHLTPRYPGEVARIVAALHTEHLALDTPDPGLPDRDDRPVLLASTADKIVALTYLRHRARRSGDPAAFFAARPALTGLLGHFAVFLAAGTGRVPATMTLHLARALSGLTSAARPPAGAAR